VIQSLFDNLPDLNQDSRSLISVSNPFNKSVVDILGAGSAGGSQSCCRLCAHVSHSFLWNCL